MGQTPREKAMYLRRYFTKTKILMVFKESTRGGQDVVTKRHHLRFVVQQHPYVELITRDVGPLFQAVQVTLLDSGCGDHLDANQMSSNILDHDIDFQLVGIPPTQQAMVAVCCGCSFEQFLKNEGFQHIATARASLLQLRIWLAV